MGQVFRARDAKLNRDVALKVLPEAFAVDADRLARFSRAVRCAGGRARCGVSAVLMSQPIVSRSLVSLSAIAHTAPACSEVTLTPRLATSPPCRAFRAPTMTPVRPGV